MPYINKTGRSYADQAVFSIVRVMSILGMKGTLNYILFKTAKNMCKSYGDYSRFIAELECCKLEIYRKLVAPYEDTKIEENGDVE